MSRVNVLSSEVIARIAAGEVVDRPASVVKELMENSLDAGADRVEVMLEDGGKRLVLVRDNGTGVAREDLECLFTRHATSKVQRTEDLDTLMSFGFRGEALYSIAAVSSVRMKTGTRDSSDAWEVCWKGGCRVGLAPASVTAPGTEIRVEDIFYNVPARKKFLRTDAIELNQVINVFISCALFYYERSFVLSNNGRKIYELSPASSCAQRAAACLNLDGRYLLEGQEDVAGDNVRLRLVLGDINIQRPRRDLQYVFINGRPVQNRNIVFQVNDVYRMILPQGVHPFFIVFMALPPEDVDVNIHPQKREVRLKQEAGLVNVLRVMVERVLMTKGGARQMGGSLASDNRSSFFVEKEELSGSKSFLEKKDQGIPVDVLRFHSRQGLERAGFCPSVSRGGSDASRDLFEAFPSREEGPLARLSRGRFMGTFACKYHLFEEGASLFLVDQHAAQERILFERIQRQISSGQVDVQRLIVPVAVRLTPAEMLAWERLKENLEKLGIETVLLGSDTVAILAHPALLSVPDGVLRKLLAEEALLSADTDTLARRACRASVMGGERMSNEAAMYQLKELLTCHDPVTCPHGRPVFIEMKMDFLDKQFFRS